MHHGRGQRALEAPRWEALRSSPPLEALLALVAALWAAQPSERELERQSAHPLKALPVVLQSGLPHFDVLLHASQQRPKMVVKWQLAPE